MRNFDHYFATYLFKHRQLAITGIGVFILADDYALPENTDNTFFYPGEAITFTYDRSQTISQNFIDEMAEVTGKNKALVSADIEQYLEHVRQYINLGRPYIMRPMGSLQKANNGSYYFTAGPVGVEKVDSSFGSDGGSVFNAKPSAEMRKRKNVVNFIVTAIVICLVGGGSWLAYSFLKKDGNTTKQDTPVAALQNDTTPINVTVPTNTVAVAANDTLRFKAVFEKTKFRAKAYQRLAVTRQRGLPANIDSVAVNDTLTRYRLFIYKKFTVADTAMQRAALSKAFATNVTLEMAAN